MLGGVLIKCLKLEIRGMMRLCLSMSFVGLLVGAGFFINCDETSFAGITVSYVGQVLPPLLYIQSDVKLWFVIEYEQFLDTCISVFHFLQKSRRQ